MPTKQFDVFLLVLFCQLAASARWLPVKIYGRKKGKSLLPVYSLVLPAASYGVWECLEVPLGDMCGARIIAMGKLSRILQKAWISSLCLL